MALGGDKLLQDINLKELIERETGDKFSREGFIKCPFHGERTPSMSVKFYPNKNKYKFKCFGCDASGDAIDFISKYKGLDYPKSREYLGIPLEKTEVEILEDKIKNFIDWELTKYREGQEMLGLFTFVNKNNEPIYYKAKFMDYREGKKKHGYYHFEGDKVIPKRGHDEVPYNYYRTIKAIQDGKVIVIVEGEKDANTINSVFRGYGYESTSFKGITDDINFSGARIYVCGDTGKAGEQYAWKIYNELFSGSVEFKFIKLPGLSALGDNKDVTDWIDQGHTKYDLERAFERSLDLKSKYEMQQNKKGIYKWVYSKKEDDYSRDIITNFKVIEAKRIRFIDDDKEGIKLILKSSTGETFEKYGYSTVFDDVKSFKNFLGTMDLSFKGDIKVLTDFKIWVNQYFAIENEEIHRGTKFYKDGDNLILITKNGSISINKFNPSIKTDSNVAMEINDIERINKKEFNQLRKHLFKFASPEKTISIIGTVVNDLTVYQSQEIKNKLHHLLVVGESGSGKSTILDNVIVPLLNMSKNDIKSIGLTSPFGLIRGLSEGNYPMLLEEFKPSSLDRFKILKLSEVLRNAYDRTSVSKGNRSLETVEFKLDRPIILVGEESYPNSEKALIERSCIVYLSKNERTEDNTKSMKWIIDNQDLLQKLGRSIIDAILNLSVEEYLEMRKIAEDKINELSNRVLTTAINIHCGMQIINKVANELGEKEIKGFEQHLIENIKTEVLDGAEEVNSVVEKMLITFNQMLEDCRVNCPDSVLNKKNSRIYIKTSEMINLLYEHTQRFGTDIIPLKLRDFKKQAKKSGYIVDESVPASMKRPDGGYKTARVDEYNGEKLRELKLFEIVEPIFEVVEMKEGESMPF